MNTTTSIVIAGVGGQGILLASEIVSRAAMVAGFDAKTNEVHGMAQRGGSVLAQVRYGKEVHSPLVMERTARVLGVFEQIEAIRFAHYLAPDGLAVVSSHKIIPVTVSGGAAKYPEDTEGILKTLFPRLCFFNATAKAEEAGNKRAANIVLLGAISTGLDLPLEAWREAIAKSVKKQFIDVNLRAFEIGRNTVG